MLRTLGFVFILFASAAGLTAQPSAPSPPTFLDLTDQTLSKTVFESTRPVYVPLDTRVLCEVCVRQEAELTRIMTEYGTRVAFARADVPSQLQLMLGSNLRALPTHFFVLPRERTALVAEGLLDASALHQFVERGLALAQKPGAPPPDQAEKILRGTGATVTWGFNRLQTVPFEPAVRRPMAPLRATASTFEKLIDQPNPVYVLFSAEMNCPPCRKQQDILQDVLAEFLPRIRFLEVDALTETDLVAVSNVHGMPTHFILKKKENTGAVAEGFLDASRLRQFFEAGVLVQPAARPPVPAPQPAPPGQRETLVRISDRVTWNFTIVPLDSIPKGETTALPIKR